MRAWLTIRLYAVFAAVLCFLMYGCGTQHVVVKPVPVEVVHEVRVPIPATLIQPCIVAEPDPACFDAVKALVRVLCNGQLATLLADYRAALHACDADKTALRALNNEPGK